MEEAALLIVIFVVVIILVLIKNSELGATTQKSEENIKKEEMYQKSGTQGEEKVQEFLKKSLNSDAFIFNNLLLEDYKGQSFQIDHLVVAPNGIWIIETKNWVGKIYGKNESEQWTQYLAEIGEYKKHYNPIKQNRRHLEKIRAVIGNTVPVFSLIVFPRADIENIDSKIVCNLAQMNRKINEDTGYLMTKSEIEYYSNLILEKRYACQTTSEEHTQKLQKRKELFDSGRCPFCGSRLIERRGNYGTFYGCSRYPYCKFIKNKYK